MISFKVTKKNVIPELRKELRPRAGRAINKWARNTLAISQQLVPVKTGFLKRSGAIVNYTDTVGDGRQRGVAKSITYTAHYAIYVHNGTIYMIARPFLLAAFEATKQELIHDLAEIFKLN